MRPLRARNDRGQSLAELALILPILLALVVGIFEFGRSWNAYQVLTNAAREGARLAVISTSDEAAVRGVVSDALTRAALDPGSGTISVDGAGGGTGTPATVSIDYPYEFTFLGPVVAMLDGDDGPLAGSITLSTTVVMRNE